MLKSFGMGSRIVWFLLPDSLYLGRTFLVLRLFEVVLQSPGACLQAYRRWMPTAFAMRLGVFKPLAGSR